LRLQTERSSCAQGEHKLQRGYLPSMTYSSHYVRNPAARGAIRNFLRREGVQMSYTIDALTAMESPFKAPPQSNQAAFAAVRATSDAERADAGEGDGEDASAGM